MAIENRKEQGIGATQETAAKLQPDPLYALYLSNRLDDYQFEAVIAIREAFKIITAPVSVRLSDPSKPPGAVGYEFETDEEEPECVKRYYQWISRMYLRRWPARPIIEIIVDHLVPKDETRFCEALKIF